MTFIAIVVDITRDAIAYVVRNNAITRAVVGETGDRGTYLHSSDTTPSPEQQAHADEVRQWFEAYRWAGFTPDHAFTLAADTNTALVDQGAALDRVRDNILTTIENPTGSPEDIKLSRDPFSGFGPYRSR